MFDYMTVQETAKLWGISERQVQKLCKANRIEGVIHLTRVWLIPRDTEKPADMRRKNYREIGK
ncbi:MAG: helix-turn-helix domain-containing protein [Lachnospiraceae bacterium]|jgi:excisionase family DNA binding protein|nr:helix-turn-helix domain-containing protein [Lachnospiraceae bacterium]